MTDFWTGDPMAPRQLDARSFPGLSLRRFACQPGARQPPHEHDLPCLVIPLRGGYAGSLTSAGSSESWESGVGDFALLPAAHSHRQAIGPKGSEALLIDILPERPSGSIGSTGSEKGLRQLNKVMRLRDRRNNPLTRKLRHELDQRDSAAELILESTLLEILAHFLRIGQVDCGYPVENHSTSPPSHLTPPKWLAPVRDRLEAEFIDPPPLVQLASSAGVSRSHLARTFRKVHGCSIGDYIRRRRLSQAAELLRTDQQLADVALNCGFYDQSHFCRAFRSHFGVAPSTWRTALSSQD
jgi:AraC family transcriptional regulator